MLIRGFHGLNRISARYSCGHRLRISKGSVMYRSLLGFVVTIIAAGQTVDRTFYFASISDPQNMQEVATLIRTIADIRQVSVDTAKRSMTVESTAEPIAIAEWLLKRLD